MLLYSYTIVHAGEYKLFGLGDTGGVSNFKKHHHLRGLAPSLVAPRRLAPLTHHEHPLGLDWLGLGGGNDAGSGDASDACACSDVATGCLSGGHDVSGRCGCAEHVSGEGEYCYVVEPTVR